MKRLLLLVLLAGCARTAPLTPNGVLAPPVTRAVSREGVHEAFVGEGSLEAKSDHSSKTKLALERVRIDAVSTGDVAETTIEHVFRNDTDAQLEGTFRFPVPEGAMLVGLALEIDGKMMDGELVTRDKARKVYEQIVDQMLDPALLEWENGQIFKLRVFPIEPRKTKRVVLRLVAPLHRTNEGLFFAFRAPDPGGGLTAERFSVRVDGKEIPGGRGESLVRVADVAPAIQEETTKDGRYFVAHVAPTRFATVKAPSRPQELVLLCDRSRSMLEARALEREVATKLAGALGAEDRFTIITGDVRTRVLEGGARKNAAEDIAAATAFLDGDEPDGASDLRALLARGAESGRRTRAEGREPVFVYLGDATPTWGETRAAELEKDARALGGPIHVVLLGKSSDETTARALASVTHGRIARPKTEAEAAEAAQKVVGSRQARRLDDVKLVGADGVDVPLLPPATIYEGDDVDLAVFVAKDKPLPALRLVGAGYDDEIALSTATSARDVGKRWAKAKLMSLDREGDAKKEEIEKISLDHGIMSRHTSFLVLESEEMYARFQIDRKAAREAEDPTAKLDAEDRVASISPDHLQPGDPEVRIPAPRDARSVVVVFPFGETKTAAFEDDDRGGAWVTRFLVDRATPDGSYEVTVRVTHADGHVEVMKLPYVVDTQSPAFDVTTKRKANGALEIHARQRLTEREIDALAPTATGTLREKRERFAQILTDAKRVEVRTPDGQLLSLVHVRLGEFVGTWTPRGAASGTLHVVAVDRALNETVMEVEIR